MTKLSQQQVVQVKVQLEQWRKNKIPLAKKLPALFIQYNTPPLDAPQTNEPDAMTTWSHFIHPLLNALYANDPEVSFCSYMWAFSEAVEYLILANPNFNIVSFGREIVDAHIPPVVPIFHQKPPDDPRTKIEVDNVRMLRAPKNITDPAVHEYYCSQLYNFLGSVALQIMKHLLSKESIYSHSSIDLYGDIHSLYAKLSEMQKEVAAKLVEFPGFQVNLLMPLMDEMPYLYCLSRREDLATPAETYCFMGIDFAVAEDDHWISKVMSHSPASLYQLSVFSPGYNSEFWSKSIQEIMTDKKLLSDLLSYQGWALTGLLKFLHTSDSKRAEMTLQILYSNLVELVPEQCHRFFETLIPIYLTNKSYPAVRLDRENIDAGLQQLPVKIHQTLIRDGLYILTPSSQLFYRKGDHQKRLSTTMNLRQIIKIASKFPEKSNTVGYLSEELLESIEKCASSHTVVFKAANALIEGLIEGSWLDDKYHIKEESMQIWRMIPLSENSFIKALKLVLATLSSEQLKVSKKLIIEHWSNYTRESFYSSFYQRYQHKINSALVYGWWDFLVYQHNFPICIIEQFKKIFGDFTDSILSSSEHLDHALATIERLHIFSMKRFPQETVYRQTRDDLVEQLFKECLIKPTLEENRQLSLMLPILKNIADLDENQVPVLMKYLLLSPYFRDYLLTIPAMELDKHGELWDIDPKYLRDLIYQNLIQSDKSKFPPIPAEMNKSEVAYPQAFLLIMMLVLVFREYKDVDMLKKKDRLQNWILSLLTQLQQKDRDTPLAKCLAELVIISNVQQLIPKRQQAKFCACVPINHGLHGESIETILATIEPSRSDKSQAIPEIPAPQKKKKRGEKTVETQLPVVILPPVIEELPVPAPVIKPLPTPVKIDEDRAEVVAPDKVSKLLQKSMQHVLQFIQKNPPEVIKLPQTFLDTIGATEQALISLQQTLKLDQTVNIGTDAANNQEAESPLSNQQKDYAIQWNRLLSQCSVALVNYCEQEDQRGGFQHKQCCENTLALFNGYYFRDPTLYLPAEVYGLLQKIAACEELGGWDHYMTGGVCLDDDFLDIDLMLVRYASYISTEDIKQAIWPKVVSQLQIGLDRLPTHVIPNEARNLLIKHGDPSSQAPQDDGHGRNSGRGPQIQSKKVFDDANCVQFEVKIRLSQGILKLDVTIYTQVSNESKVVQDTMQSLVSTGAMRWKLNGRMLILPQTALAIFAKNPVLKVIVPQEMLIQMFLRERNKIGYICKHMSKYSHFRLDPKLPEALEMLIDSKSKGVDSAEVLTRFEQALTYLLDEKRFSSRPQITAHFILNRFNLLALRYTSQTLNAEFHQACVAGFKRYFGKVLDNNPNPDDVSAAFTNIEFLTMYFISGLLQFRSDAIQPLLSAFTSWPTIGGVNTQDLLNILNVLPKNDSVSSWQQQLTPNDSAMRIKRYWKFPELVPIKPLSPESDPRSSSSDAAVEVTPLPRTSTRQSYGHFYQPPPEKVSQNSASISKKINSDGSIREMRY